MKLRAFAIVLFFFLTTGLAQQQTFWVPQFGDGGSGGALRFASTITVVNLSSEILNPSRVTVESFDVDGNPLGLLRRVTIDGPEAASSVDLELPGLGTEVVSSNSGNPAALNLGWVRLTTEDNLAVEVLFSIFSANGALITTTSILPRPLTTEATIIVAAGNNAVSNLAILNPPTNQQTAEVVIEVFDRFGQSVGSGVISGCEPGQRVAQNLVELIPALQGQTDFVGTASISSNVEIAILPLRQTPDGQLSTQDALPARD